MSCCGISLNNTEPKLHSFVSRVAVMAYSQGITLVINKASEDSPMQSLKLGALGSKGTGEITMELNKVVASAIEKVGEGAPYYDEKTGIVSMATPAVKVSKQKKTAEPESIIVPEISEQNESAV